MADLETRRDPARTNSPLDLADPDLYASEAKYAVWREGVLSDAPVWSDPGASPVGFWSVFSHASCRAVLRPTAPFTSRYGMMLGFGRERPDPSGGQMLVVTDGEHHSRLRRVVEPFLSRAMASSLADFIEGEVRRLLTGLVEGEVTDVAVDVGPLLPAAVVCEILGVPESDREKLVELTNHAFGGHDPTFGKLTPGEAHSEILLYFFDLIEERSKSPRDDLVSALIQEVGLSRRDILVNCDNILIGGNETTRHAVAGCFHGLSTAPGLLDKLRDVPSAIPNAVEEIIRWTSPALHVLRVATDDVLVGGHPVRRGDAVVSWLPAANRDPTVFEEPAAFVPNRRMNKHLGFGYGPHHCLGAALARAELSGLLTVLAETIGDIHLTDPHEWLRATAVQGYRRLNIIADPRRR